MIIENLAEMANKNKNLAESKEGEVGAGWDLEQGEEHRGEKGNVETELPTKDVGNKAGRREITSHCTDVQDSDGPEGLPMCDGLIQLV